jgi:predicted Zn finger-like uncharacterized protein
MSLRIVCPGCQAVYTVADDLRGKKARCRQCQLLFPIEAPAAPAAAPEAAVAAPPAAEPLQALPVETPAPAPAAPPPVVQAVEPADRPAPRRAPPPRRRPADDDEPRPRRRRKQKSAGGLILLLLLGGGLFAFCIVGSVVLAIMYAFRDPAGDFSVVQVPPSGQAVPAVEPAPPVPVEDPRDDPADNAPKEPQIVLDPPLKEPTRDIPTRAAPPVSPTGQLAPEILTKVKRATVYIRVAMADGRSGSGSGFFGVEPGIVLTNCHVVGMMAAGASKPRHLEVIVNSGEGPEEKTLPGEVISVDRVNDLAVLRVKLDKQPTPLEVKSALSLKETQPVYVFGFPFGESLGKNVTITNTTVSSLRKDQATGVLTRVQVQGGMHPGNSGGPVVDAWGDVVGVSVAKFMPYGQDARIDFAVPGDYVQVILGGHLTELACGLPYRDGTQVKLPVTVQALDPLRRIRKLAINYWVGDAGKPRPASRTEPKAEPGDGPRQTQLLTYQGGVGKGELTLPGLPPGKTYWLQANYGSEGGTKWAVAQPTTLQPIIERKPATLARKFQPGEKHDLVLTHKSTLQLRDAHNNEHPAVSTVEAHLTETTEAVDAQGVAEVRWQYTRLRARSRTGDQRQVHPLQGAPPYITTLGAKLRLDATGKVLQQGMDIPEGAAPPGVRPILATLHEQYAEPLLEVLMPPLPGKEVRPDTTWKGQRRMRADTMMGQHETVTLNVSYTYAGERTRAGRAEAVLTLNGTARPGSATTDNGRIQGTLVLDRETGRLLEADMTVHLDLSITVFLGQSMPVSSVQEIKLRPEAEKPAGKS